VAGIVVVGQERGLFRFDVEPKAAAEVFIAGIMGAEIQHYQDAGEVRLEDVMACFVEGFLTWACAPRPGFGELSAETRFPGGER
jgi:hypothetical protein